MVEPVQNPSSIENRQVHLNFRNITEDYSKTGFLAEFLRFSKMKFERDPTTDHYTRNLPNHLRYGSFEVLTKLRPAMKTRYR
ncbi:hypothetical protein LSTR_LSTR002603 [Laodelphax striatellus]|uniref:Uncharacterized protein n=1 Tax=Laodelphax striatellus TaxID=195883 RepID=A0A482XMI4_LAOST|nr:hypothetical protein LSTR_LSTR002603 [Laodelphax striatellus]